MPARENAAASLAHAMTNRLLIRNATLQLPSGPLRADVLCDGGRIAAIGPDLEASDTLVLDASGLQAGPGFIDIHVHGGGGHSFFSKDPANVRAYAAWAPRNGVTSFLVSTIGRDGPETTAVFAGLAAAVGAAEGEAEVLGFHLEGPFINPERRGAFHPNMLRPPDPSEFERHQEAAGGAIRQVTLAPELPGALRLVESVVRSGAVASMGHTDATVEQARAGFDRGIRHVTHLYNAMRPLHHREGGPSVAALLEDAVTCELICDGAHLSPDVLRLAYRALGPRRAVVVTDNLHIAGTDAAGGTFGGQQVAVEGAKAVRQDGTIVGSVATMDQHFRNAVAFLGIGVAEAFGLCATNPARVIGAGSRKGAVEKGMDADIVLLDDGLKVVATVCRGVVAYDRRSEPPGRS